MLTFLGRVSFHENGIISELYHFRMLAPLHSSQFMAPLLEAISPLEHSLYTHPREASFSRLSSVYTLFALHSSQLTLSLKWIFPLKNSLLNTVASLSSSPHGTASVLHPASQFQRIQCQTSSSISPYHPHCLPVSSSHTHAVFSPA